jgi:hypothetical protein
VGTLGLELFRQPFVFVHRSHSFVVFRHSSDERNTTDVTGSSIGYIPSLCFVIVVTSERQPV